MRVSALLQKSKKELQNIALNPHQESLWILAEVLELSSSEVYLEKEPISSRQQELFWQKIQKRKQGLPLEYILKEKIFFQKAFRLEEGVFIPRAETEALIHWVLNHKPEGRLKAMDFGAGSGALCLSLLSQIPDSQFLAVEISRKAIQCLRENHRLFHLEDRLTLLQKDVCQVTKEETIQILGSAPSLIVSNPPYIDPKDESLDRQVYLFDPPLALFSDQQGMGHIMSWFEKAMELLSPKGIYIFEFGWNQENQVRDFCASRKELEFYEIHKDAAGHSRMAVCFKK